MLPKLRQILGQWRNPMPEFWCQRPFVDPDAGSLTLGLVFFAGNTQLLHAGLKSSPLHAQARGRAVDSRNDSARFAQSSKNVIPFHVFESVAQSAMTVRR